MLEIIRGDTSEIEFPVVDSAGQPYELEGSEVFFTVKRKLKDTDDEAVFKTNFPFVGSGNVVTITIPKDSGIVSGVYFYDLQFKVDDVVQSIPKGRISVTEDITKRIS